MNTLLKLVLQNFMCSTLDYTSDKFIYADFAEEYDTELLHQYVLLQMTISLINSIEKQEINEEYMKKVVQILQVSDVDISQVDLSQCSCSVDEILSGNAKILEFEYNYRYRVIEAIMYIFSVNGKKIKRYQEFIKIAAYLKIKKTDFIYLITKYKGEEE